MTFCASTHSHHCNLGYLQRFPLDILKIDKSFITDLGDEGSLGALASSIVGLATTLKLHTVAEGVEHADQRSQLIALGCSSGQGFLFAKPVDAEVVTELMRSGSTRSAPGKGAQAVPVLA